MGDNCPMVLTKLILTAMFPRPKQIYHKTETVSTAKMKKLKLRRKAAPDNKYKTLWVETAYMKKRSPRMSLMNVSIP